MTPEDSTKIALAMVVLIHDAPATNNVMRALNELGSILTLPGTPERRAAFDAAHKRLATEAIA